jgi:F0F1-type ATP synthase membrane subunit b/b'
MGFFRENFPLLILAALAVFWVWILLRARSRQSKVDAYLDKAQADAEESKRHMAAVEQKLDRIIALMQRDPGDDA